MPFPRAAFGRLARTRSVPTTVHRRDTSTDTTYGEDITYSTLEEPRDILFVGFEESRQNTGAGERQSTRLAAYTDPTVDLQVNDRIDHGGDRYEVAVKEGRPDELDPAIYRFEFENV